MLGLSNTYMSKQKLNVVHEESRENLNESTVDVEQAEDAINIENEGEQMEQHQEEVQEMMVVEQ